MAKMNAEIAKRVKALGINAKTEDDAREKLLEILNENGIEGMEEEDTDTLIEIAESFVEEGGSSDTDDTDSTDESETSDEDALADEVEAEEAEEEDTDEAEDVEEDALASMDRTALKAYIKDNGLDIKVKKSWSDDDIREQIRNAECPVAEAEEETEEEPTPAPAPKKAEKKEKKATEKKATEKKVSKRGQKLDPKNNEEDRKAFEALYELFPEEEYSYAWVASAGVTIKHKGKNSQRAMVLIENCSKQADESIKCNLYLLTFSKQTDVLDEAGIEYEICWSGAPFMKGITMDSAVEIIKTLMPNITATVQKIDKRLGENRAKMEESLSKKAAPAAKKTAAKKTVKK